MSGPRHLVVAMLRFYQQLTSPAFGQRCRYYPSWSEYAVQPCSGSGYPRSAAPRLAAAPP
jgi:putative component of membrane protein insertase Oxa1/YidC/SpoIIIJ protein YidD